MGLNIFHYFQPKNKIFFTLFEKATENLVTISTALNEMVNTSSPEKRAELIREIERLENVGDSITHETFKELSANFITPFDREDWTILQTLHTAPLNVFNCTKLKQ